MLSCGGDSTWPEFLPLAAPTEGIEGCDGSGVGAVPPATMPFQAFRAEFALGFGGPAANLPPVGAKRGVSDHFLTRGNVFQQPIGRLAFAWAGQLDAPLDKSFPG